MSIFQLLESAYDHIFISFFVYNLKISSVLAMSIGSNRLFLWDNKHAINGVTVNTSSWYNSGHICKHEQFVQPVVTIQLDNTRP